MTSPMFAPLRPEETAASVPVASADEWKALIPVPADVPRSIPKHALGQPSAWWKYQDASGTLLGLAVRFDPPGGKQVLPLTYCEGPNGIREWRWKAFPEPRPLYGLDRLAQRPTVRVVVTEGEKAADAAAKMFPDVVAITWPGGAKATAKADWSPLAGRDVLLWPDHDQPGRDAMTAVADELAAVGAAALALVNVPAEFPEGWDLADAPPVGWNTDRLGLLIDTARRIETVSEVQRDEGVGNIEAEISRLAALPPIEYQTQRKTAAKRLGGMRASALDDFVKAKREENSPAPSKSNALELPTPEPWPDPVEGAALLSNMTAAIRRHVVMEEGAPEIVAFWVIYAHALDAFGISPRLSITSPEKGCGKTTALDVVGRLVPRPLHVANISAAAIFRTIEAAQPTLLIDEGDTFLKDNDEIRGILNSGHRKSAAFVVRTVGDDHEPRKFSTWAATAIAMIGRLPDTLEVRSVPVRLRRRLDSETIESLRGDKASHLDVLGRMAARWALDNFEAIRAADPVMPDGIINRAADNWRPILAIADVAGGEWPARMRQIALAVAGPNTAEQSARVMLLEDVKATFEAKGTDRLSSHDLVAALVEMEDRPWPDWRQGRPITSSGVARLLSGFRISPKNIRKGSAVVKGYQREQFEDAFSRYIPVPPEIAATPLQPASFCGNSGQNETATHPPCSGSENAGKANAHAACSVVAAEKPWEGEI